MYSSYDTFSAIFVFLCLLARGRQSPNTWKVALYGDDFFRRSLNSKFWEPLGKTASHVSESGISRGDKGRSVNPFSQLAFAHDFSSPAYLSKQFSLSFVLHFLKICSQLYFKWWQEKAHLQMPTGKSIYFKQCCSRAPAAVAMLANWFLGVVRRIKHVMSNCFNPTLYWLGLFWDEESSTPSN